MIWEEKGTELTGSGFGFGLGGGSLFGTGTGAECVTTIFEASDFFLGSGLGGMVWYGVVVWLWATR